LLLLIILAACDASLIPQDGCIPIIQIPSLYQTPNP
jgi:hypothetical protein